MIPQVEKAIALHLCLQNSATWRGRLRLLSRECKFSLFLVARAYSTLGQDTSALNAMALKELNESRPNPEMMQEVHSVTDHTQWATKVTAQILG